MIKLAILGIVAFVVSLIVTVPAHFAGGYLPPGIQASGLQGTLWQGQARRLQVRGFNLGEVTWEIRPYALLLGRIQADVSMSRTDLQGRGSVARGLTGYHILDARLQGDERFLAPFAADYGVTVDGRIEADIDELAFNDDGPQAADGMIAWREARLLNPSALVLGNVNVTLNQEGDTAVAELRNTGDELRLNGDAQLQSGWNYNARLQIAPTPATPKQVRDALPFLGQPDARGAVIINQQGKLTTVAASLP